MRRPNIEHRGERGQILIMFTLAIAVIVGMLGLVLDGGAAYAQRRQEQGVADLAAMAGAMAHLNTQGDAATKTAAADAGARAIATANGYTAGVDNAIVDVIVASSGPGTTVRVNLTGKHRNNFASLVGMPTWDVTVTAAAVSSDSPNGATGVMPLLFNKKAFPGAICDETAGPCTAEIYQLPGTGNEDVPQDATQFNWTVFCAGDGGGTCEGDSSDVREILGAGGNATTIYLNDAIGPLNAGTHTTLLDTNSGNESLTDHIGETFPVPIVDDDGKMVGFAYFKLLDVEGAPDKVIRGYFVSPVNATKLVISPTGGTAQLNTGVFKLSLVD